LTLAFYKAILNVDDREDALARYCLVTAIYSIEQYCKRHILRKKIHEVFPFYGEYSFVLREYPVREVLAVFQMDSFKASNMLENDFYRTVPEAGTAEDWPYSLSVTPALRLVRGRGRNTPLVTTSRRHTPLLLRLLKPVGKTEIMIVFSSVSGGPTPEHAASWRSLYGMCKNSGDTLEAFLERKHADKAFEDAIEERRFKERAKAKGETPQE
jgi:hypothetical protein